MPRYPQTSHKSRSGSEELFNISERKKLGPENRRRLNQLRTHKAKSKRRENNNIGRLPLNLLEPFQPQTTSLASDHDFGFIGGPPVRPACNEDDDSTPSKMTNLTEQLGLATSKRRGSTTSSSSGASIYTAYSQPQAPINPRLGAKRQQSASRSCWYIRYDSDGATCQDEKVKRQFQYNPSQPINQDPEKAKREVYHQIKVSWQGGDVAHVGYDAMKEYFGMMGGMDGVCSFYDCVPDDISAGKYPPIACNDPAFIQGARNAIEELYHEYMHQKSYSSSSTKYSK